MRQLLVKHIMAFIMHAFLLQAIQAQGTGYAKYVIDSLCSPHLHGRGYVFKGDRIAARFIASEFSNYQLKKPDTSYFQAFNININTFPSNIELVIDGKKLQPGIDFLPAANSGHTKDTCQTVWFTKKNAENDGRIQKFLKKDLRNKIVVVDPEGVEEEEQKRLFEGLMYYNPFNSKGILYLNRDKLSWNTAPGISVQNSFCIELHPASINRKSEVFVHLENEYLEDYETYNVIGLVEGKEQKDSFYVFTAHYDHLGRLGKDVYFPGAHDNASGVAMILSLAGYFALPENQPDCSIMFIACSGEEIGLKGSCYFADNSWIDLNKIKFLINLDIIGYGEEGIMIVNGKTHPEAINLMKQINAEESYVKKIKIRGAAANSDHHCFHEKGVPAVFIFTLGGNSEYHNPLDTPENLSLATFENLFRLLVDFTRQYK